MAIKFHPRAGQILPCDFSTGFKTPEMVKHNRPVVVISKPNKQSSELVTVLPLSTQRPHVILPYHYLIPKNSMPQLRRFQKSDT